MQAHQDNISAKVNGVLTPILGVQVTVTDTSTGRPAALYSDNGVTALAQPLTTDETGYFGFYAANGHYSLAFSSPQIRLGPRVVQLYDTADDLPLTQAQAAASSGASKIGIGAETVENALNALQLADYSALRAYTGPRKSVYVTGYTGTAAPSGIAGMFVRDDHDTTTADNGGTIIVATNGKRWKRNFHGRAFAEWFGADPTGLQVSSSTIQSAINAHGYVQVGNGTFVIDQPLVFSGAGGLFGNKMGTVLQKTTATANNITRTYVDSSGATQTLTWNLPNVIDVVCPTNSYLGDFQIDGISFSLASDASVGVLNCQRVENSSFTNLFCNTSAFFIKGYDMWEIKAEMIRSRFSKDHFDINTGTSWAFSNVSCDTKYSTGGTGFTLTNVNYIEMGACAADSVDRCYYFSGGQVTMNGCGAESFSRLLQAANGARVTVNGGNLAVYKVGSFTGEAVPYAADGANTQVTFINTWLGIANPAAPGGTYDQMSITNGAKVSAIDVRPPAEIANASGNWWYVANANSSLRIIDDSGLRYYTQYGLSKLDASGRKKTFSFTKTGVPAGSAQSIFRIGATAAGSGYGDSFSADVEINLCNGYGTDIGFAGILKFAISGFNEATKSQNITPYASSITSTNTANPVGAVTASLLRNADGTVDFQLNIANSPVAGTTDIDVEVKYAMRFGTGLSANVITGL